MEAELLGADPEKALHEHIATLPAQRGLAVRTLSHAWTGGGGTLQVGKLAVRLVVPSEKGGYTAATIRSDRAELEIGRVVLESHGVPSEAWMHWSDDLAELRPHGFDAAAKYPVTGFGHLSDMNLARLVGGMRDLARLAVAAKGRA